MAKTTRKKKEPETVIQEQPVMTVSSPDSTTVVVNPQPEKAAEEVKPEPVPTNPAGQIPAQPVMTLELVVATYKKELTKLRYQEALQGYASMKVTEDNIKDVQEKMKLGRGLIRKMEALKGELKAPSWKICTMWDKAFNDLSEPLENLLSKIQIDLNKVSDEQARKKAAADKEKKRIEDINNDIDNVLMGHSQEIATATKAEQLVAIEKMIGSQKANKTRFQEFLPIFIERANELTPQIKNQKQAIKDLEDLERQKKEAEEKGDDATLIALEDKKEELISQIDENKVLVQESMINQATKPNEIVTVQPVFNTIKPRYQKWKAELKTDDKSMKLALNAGLLKCTLDPDKIDVLIETLQSTKQLDGLETFEINGIKLYLEKRY